MSYAMIETWETAEVCEIQNRFPLIFFRRILRLTPSRLTSRHFRPLKKRRQTWVWQYRSTHRLQCRFMAPSMSMIMIIKTMILYWYFYIEQVSVWGCCDHELFIRFFFLRRVQSQLFFLILQSWLLRPFKTFWYLFQSWTL